MSRIIMLTGFASGLIYFRQPLLRALVAAGHEVIAAAPEEDDRVAPAMAAIGVDWRPIEFDRNHIRPAGDLRFLREVRSLLRTLAPDRLLCATLKPNIYGGWAAQSEGVKSAAMVTGIGTIFMKPGLKRRVVARMLRRACRHHDLVFVQNADDRDDLLTLGVVEDSSKIIMTAGEGIDLKEWQPCPLPPEPVFLMLSRLLVSKGVREYIEAARMLKDWCPTARVQLAGQADPGSGGVPMAEIIEAHEQGVIEYLGLVTNVKQVIAQSNVCVLPSWHEGTPHAVLESMAMGRPVVTTDVRGCRETVIEGETGLLVPLQDSRALATAMAQLGGDHSRRVSMGNAGRLLAESRFDAQDVSSKMLKAMQL